jgi:hypothetical protein
MPGGFQRRKGCARRSRLEEILLAIKNLIFRLSALHFQLERLAGRCIGRGQGS